MIFHGRIVPADGSADPGGWSAYRLVLAHTAVVDGVPRSLERSIALRDDGGYSLDPGDPVPADAFLSVVSPEGQTLARREFSSLVADGTANLAPFPVDPRDLGLVIDPAAEPVDQRARISGRVFVAAGASGDHSAAAELEVRVFGTSGDRAPFAPLFSGVTDRRGYCAGPAQRRRLTAAFAETGTGAAVVALDRRSIRAGR